MLHLPVYTEISTFHRRRIKLNANNSLIFNPLSYICMSIYLKVDKIQIQVAAGVKRLIFENKRIKYFKACQPVKTPVFVPRRTTCLILDISVLIPYR